MSTVLQYGTLDLNDGTNYKLMAQGFIAPPPPVKQQYADSALTHGQLPTESWKYNNRVLTFSIRVLGTDPTNLDANIRALETVVLSPGQVVTYCPSGRDNNIYFNAYRPDAIDPSTYFMYEYNQLNTQCIITWTVQAYPFGFTDRQNLFPCQNLGPNDSFEIHASDDFEKWVEVDGVSANTSDYLTGGISVQITGSGSITDEAFLPPEGLIDPTHSYNAKLFAFANSGTVSLNFDLHCYDDTGSEVADSPVSLLTAYNPTAATWMDVIEVARRTGIGSGRPIITPDMWPDGTTMIKREISNTSGTVSIDSLIFEDSEYLGDNHLEGAFCIDIPNALGDVPAPAQITVGSAFCSGPFSLMHSGLVVSGLKGISGYDATHIWAVADNGHILFFNGSTWVKQNSGVVYGFKAVYALDADHVWAVGWNGTPRFWNGSSWGAGATANLWFEAIDGYNSTHVWGVGSNLSMAGGGAIVFFNGSTWTSTNFPHLLYGVSALNATHIYAVGEAGCIAISNGTTWSHKHYSVHDFHGVCAIDSTHVWFVGNRGIIFFWDGTSMTRVASGVTTNLHAVYGYDTSHVWAVGDNGLILTFDGTSWSIQAGSGSKNNLYGVYALADNQVWVVGDGGTILKGVLTVGSMPMTNLIVGQRAAYASDFEPVQDAAGGTQEVDVYRRGQYYRSLVAGGTHKFKYPVGAHRGRYILSIGTSWASTAHIGGQKYDKLTVKLYLETADGTKISATDIILPPLDMNDPNTEFRETAFQGTRLTDITIPSHYISPSANQDNINQIIEVSNNASAPAEWLDCCTLIPVDCAVELSGMANNFIVLDSEEGMVMSSQDGSLDTAAVFDPALTVDTPRFVINPSGTQMVVLAGNIISGDDRLSPLLDISISYEPQYWLIPE